MDTFSHSTVDLQGDLTISQQHEWLHLPARSCSAARNEPVVSLDCSILSLDLSDPEALSPPRSHGRWPGDVEEQGGAYPLRQGYHQTRQYPNTFSDKVCRLEALEKHKRSLAYRREVRSGGLGGRLSSSQT